VAYAIGVSQPLSLYVDTHGTGTGPDASLERAVEAVAKDRLGGLTPRGIRDGLSLKSLYSVTAAWPSAFSPRWRPWLGPGRARKPARRPLSVK
jgi:S-adenosylmethionine synthetase